MPLGLSIPGDSAVCSVLIGVHLVLSLLCYLVFGSVSSFSVLLGPISHMHNRDHIGFK